MAKFSQLCKDISGLPIYGLYPSDLMFQLKLSASTVKTINVPTDYKEYDVYFSFDPGSFIWVSYDGNDPTIPTLLVNSCNCEPNPSIRRVSGGSLIKMITSDIGSPEVGVQFRAFS